MGPVRQESVKYLFGCLPGHIAVEVNPRLHDAAATTDIKCDICRLAPDQRWNSYAVLIIVVIIVITEGISLWLAV